jgi:hypothetical protein
MTMLWWIPLGVAGGGAVALGLINRALAREAEALQKALRTALSSRRHRAAQAGSLGDDPGRSEPAAAPSRRAR